MSKPKRQRTVYPTIKDRQTDTAMFPTVRVERSKVTVSQFVFAGYNKVSGEELEASWDRMLKRAERLGQLLQARWFGTVPS